MTITITDNRPKPPPPPRYLVGLDLGQAADFTAVVTVEQTADRDDRGRPVPAYAVRHLERFHLGTPYPEQVAKVRTLFAKPPLKGAFLVVDRTGVGRAVYDMIARGGVDARVTGWTITAGSKPGDGTVPKFDLVAAVQAALTTRRLHIAPGLPLARTLADELTAFRVKVTPDRNETFASWRERDHDDLVLALALAVWFGGRLGVPGGSSAPGAVGGGRPADSAAMAMQFGRPQTR